MIGAAGLSQCFELRVRAAFHEEASVFTETNLAVEIGLIQSVGGLLIC